MGKNKMSSKAAGRIQSHSDNFVCLHIPYKEKMI